MLIDLSHPEYGTWCSLVHFEPEVELTPLATPTEHFQQKIFHQYWFSSTLLRSQFCCNLALWCKRASTTSTVLLLTSSPSKSLIQSQHVFATSEAAVNTAVTPVLQDASIFYLQFETYTHLYLALISPRRDCFTDFRIDLQSVDWCVPKILFVDCCF
jgi:hypothetical protein